MRAENRWTTSIRVAAVSNPALTTPGTAVTSLILTPLLEVLLLVAVTASVGSDDLRGTAYAGVVLAFGLTVLAGTVEQVTLDRRLGVIQEVVAFGLRNPSYWAGKLAVPVVLGVVPAVAGSCAVLALDPAHDGAVLARTLLLIPVAAVAGGLVGVAASIASLALSDPYLVPNAAHSILLVTAGVVLPIGLYPHGLALVAQALPFTAIIEAVRTEGPLWPLLLRELLVSAVWCAVGLAIARRVMSALRSGRRTTEVW